MADIHTLYENEQITDFDRADRAIYELFDVCKINGRSLIVMVENDSGDYDMAFGGGGPLNAKNVLFAMERVKHNLLSQCDLAELSGSLDRECEDDD